MDGISPVAETTANAHYDYIAAMLYCLTSPGHPVWLGGGGGLYFEKATMG